jgi:hypothetical protein
VEEYRLRKSDNIMVSDDNFPDIFSFLARFWYNKFGLRRQLHEGGINALAR